MRQSNPSSGGLTRPTAARFQTAWQTGQGRCSEAANAWGCSQRCTSGIREANSSTTIECQCSASSNFRIILRRFGKDLGPRRIVPRLQCACVFDRMSIGPHCLIWLLEAQSVYSISRNSRPVRASLRIHNWVDNAEGREEVLTASTPRSAPVVYRT
jgi:hypothetical protein